MKLPENFASTPPFIGNIKYHEIPLPTSTMDEIKKFKNNHLKKLEKSLFKEIALFKRRKKEHQERVIKYKILIKYTKFELCQTKKLGKK
jgi:hypothetical protein